MPVVRELVNRISFKVNPADKKNATDVINSLDQGSKRAVTNIKGIGKAIAATLAGASAIAAKVSVESEQNRASVAFFSKNKEQREEIIALSEKQADISELISKREAIQAAKTFSRLNISKKQLEDLIPLAAKVQEARPDVDFNEVTKLVSDVIAGGDLKAITELAPGFKGEAELLSKTKFGGAFGEITQEQRGQILTDVLKKALPEIEKLAKEQADTISFQFTRIGASGSDIVTDLAEGFNLLAKGPAKFLAESLSGESKGVKKDIEEAKGLTFEKFKSRLAEGVEKDLPFLFPKKSKQETQGDQSLNINLNGSIKVENQSGVEISQMSEDLTNKAVEVIKASLNNLTASNGGFVGVQ